MDEAATTFGAEPDAHRRADGKLEGGRRRREQLLPDVHHVLTVAAEVRPRADRPGYRVVSGALRRDELEVVGLDGEAHRLTRAGELAFPDLDRAPGDLDGAARDAPRLDDVARADEARHEPRARAVVEILRGADLLDA